jgi:predicted small lipoprotein YifL
MARMTASRILVTLTLLAAMTAVTACGRKSGLDTPYEAAVQARKDAEKAKQPVPPEPEKPVEDRKFVLDPLI